MKMRQKDWKNSFGSDVKTFRYENNITSEYQEIDEEIYDNFLGAVPPKYLKNGFQCGEPYSTKYNQYDKTNIPTYSTFGYINDKYFYIGIFTTDEAQKVLDLFIAVMTK